MHTWFECKIRYEKTMENGMNKKVTEPYLVDALSFTEAEARIIEEMTPFISGEFTVSDIKRANYSELFPSEEESADRWFKCKLVFITLDEKSGAEKKTSTQVLVQAADLRADDGRPIPSDSIGTSGFCNAHGLGACIRRLGARPLSRPRSVLFIGNSYTYYNLVPGIVRELASFEGRDLRVEMFTIGGCTMERHLEQADCRDLIERGGYDFVVLQDQSLHPALIGTPDDQGIAGRMEAIVAHIRTHNPKVRPYVEMTWGRRDGYTDRKFDYDFLRSYASMQERIRVNTLAEAEAVGAGCIPVGVAWSRVRTERPDIELYAADGSHPSYAGSYLAAAVICTTLTGAPFGAAPSDGLLDPDTAAYLRRVAEQTVLGGE